MLRIAGYADCRFLILMRRAVLSGVFTSLVSTSVMPVMTVHSTSSMGTTLHVSCEYCESSK